MLSVLCFIFVVATSVTDKVISMHLSASISTIQVIITCTPIISVMPAFFLHLILGRHIHSTSFALHIIAITVITIISLNALITTITFMSRCIVHFTCITIRPLYIVVVRWISFVPAQCVPSQSLFSSRHASLLLLLTASITAIVIVTRMIGL